MLMFSLVVITWAAASIFAFGAAWLGTWIRHDLRHWPLLWASCLLISLITPFIGVALICIAPDRISELNAPWQGQEILFLPLNLADHSGASAADPSWFDLAFWRNAALCVYVLGLILHIARLVIGRRRVRAIVRDAQPLRQHAWPHVSISKFAPTPFVWTPFGRPRQSRIILPTHYLEAFSPGEVGDIIRHEQQHIARRDDEVGLVLRVCLAVLWWSPFAQAAFSRWVQASEIQCDAAVLAGTSHEMRRAYAQSLLKALHMSADRVRQYPAASFSTHRLRNEKMRMRHIMAGTGPIIKRPRLALLVAATALCLPGAAGFASLAQAETPGAETGTYSLGDMLSGRLTAAYGVTGDPFKTGQTRVHTGIDIAAPLGTEIRAPADGIILEATDLYLGRASYGKVVVFETGTDTRTVLAHLNAYNVEPGQRVEKGDIIGEVGSTGASTGPHVHIETFVAGERVDPSTIWSVD